MTDTQLASASSACSTDVLPLDNPLAARCLAAWHGGGETIQPQYPVRQYRLDGVHYLVLQRDERVLAVYRVREELDRLKRMKRFPSIIHSLVEGPGE